MINTGGHSWTRGDGENGAPGEDVKGCESSLKPDLQCATLHTISKGYGLGKQLQITKRQLGVENRSVFNRFKLKIVFE